MAQGVKGGKMKEVEKICRNGQMYQNHLVRSIKWSSDQLHFDSCACSLHAFCMHTCQDWVSQNWIDMMSVHDAQIIRVFFNHHLTCLHAIFLHEVQNVCHLSRLCVLVVIPKSKWYVAFQTPTLCYFYFAKEEVFLNKFIEHRNTELKKSQWSFYKVIYVWCQFSVQFP